MCAACTSVHHVLSVKNVFCIVQAICNFCSGSGYQNHLHVDNHHHHHHHHHHDHHHHRHHHSNVHTDITLCHHCAGTGHKL